MSFLIALFTGASSIDNLYILQWNANGFRTHSAELRNHVARKSGIYDIICMHETSLKPDVKFNIAGYVTLRRDRLDAGTGGLVTLIKQNIKYISSYNIKDILLLLLLLLLQATYLRAAKVNHIGESEARFSRS